MKKIAIVDCQHSIEELESLNSDCRIRDFCYVIEQVPETWEDLKDLCNELEGKDVFITSAGDCIEFRGLLFWQDGSITTDKELVYAIKTEVTPARVWQIIKSLIGEE